ncbi:MAG: hypothetical protein J7L88_01385 [Thermoplasmata archaeon]|nr:hypothetical protein [Thermoplasmata archaeon]
MVKTVNSSKEDEEEKRKALERLVGQGLDFLKGDALDEIVYSSLVDLLVRGIIEYDPVEDTFVLKEGLEDQSGH